MAKKLGILALVVCMLLTVAVVANAVEPIKVTVNGTVQNGECMTNPYHDTRNGTYQATAKSLHFFETLSDGLDEQICDYCGAVWSEEHKADHEKNGVKNAKPTTLANWRTFADKVSGSDKDKVLDFTTKEFTIDEIKSGKSGWKVWQPGAHTMNNDVSTIYRRTCAYCGLYQQYTVENTHNWVADTSVAGQEDLANPVIDCENGVTLNDGKTYKCSICNKKETATKLEIPAPGHDWKVVDRVSSCTVPGGKGAVCARCGKTSKEVNAQKNNVGFHYTGDDMWEDYDNGAVLGHQWVVAYAASDKNGTKIKEPKDNSKSDIYYDKDTVGAGLYASKDVPDGITTKDPKCVSTEQFYVVYKCARANCDGHKDATAPKNVEFPAGTQYTDEVVSKDGLILVKKTPTSDHVWGKESDFIPATCVLTGHYTKTCQLCGLTEVSKVEKVSAPTGHTFAKDTEVKPIHKAGANGKDSVHTRECTVCGALVEEKCDKITEVPANCENGGGAIVNCTICGFKQNWLDPNGKKLDADALEENNAKQHYGYYLNGETTTDEAKLAKWTTKKEKVALGCNKTGLVEYVCNVCGETIKTVQVAGKHDMVLSSTQLKDCTQDWVEVWVCSREDCPGVSVKAGLETSGSDEKGDWTATITTVDKKAAQRRVYKANKTHTIDKNDPTKIEVVKEANCGVTGEGYRLCTICGQRAEKYDIPATGKHEYTKADEMTPATCIEPARVGQICKVCGQVKPGTTATDVENSEKLGHNYANPTYYESKTAAEAGKAIDQIDKPTKCDKGYWTRTVCTRCGDVKTEETKAGQHKYAETATHLAPDCENNDRQAKVCTVCGAEQLVLDNYLEAGGDGIADPSLKATGHKWDTATLVEDPDATGKNTKHQKICSVCGAKVTEACTYETDKEQTKKATCANVAVTVEVCKVCKNAVVTYGTALDPKNHDYKQVALKGEEPTCTEKGFVREECPDCGAIGKTIEVEALGHAWERKTGDWTTGLVITTAPTCVSDGVGHRECEFCDLKTEDFVIGKYDGKNTAFGHTWTRADYVWSADQLTVDVAPTCTVDGKGHYVCADCGYVLETGIPHYDGANTPYGHTWTRADYVWSIDQLKISVEPTCVKDGEGYYECTDCGYKMTGVVVPHYDGANTPYGHIWAREPWPAGLQQHEDGTYYYECPDCHYTQEAE